MERIIYCCPYSASNLLYPLPIVYLQFDKKDLYNYKLKNEDCSYFSTNYKPLYLAAIEEAFKFNVHFIESEEGEKYGYSECLRRAINQLSSYNVVDQVITRRADHLIASRLGNYLVHLLKKNYLERYVLFDPHVLQHEGRPTIEHLSLIQQYNTLPYFYRKIKAASLCYRYFRQKPNWAKEYSR